MTSHVLFGDGITNEPSEDDVLDFSTVEKTEQEEREELIEELTHFATACSYTKKTIEHAAGLSIEDLREYVRVQRKNAGGSVTVAQLISDTDESYLEFLDSELLKRKVSIIEAKGRDFMRVAQRISATVGQDIAIEGMKFKDYHELLRHIVAHASIVDNAVSTVASALGIEVPFDVESPVSNKSEMVPVIPGQILPTKSTLYILNVILNNMQYFVEHANTLSTMYHKIEIENEKLRSDNATAKRLNAEMLDRTSAVISRVESTLKNTASYVVKKGSSYIGKYDPEQRLSKRNLAEFDNIDFAIFFSSKATATDFVLRLNGCIGELEVVRLVETVG